MEPDEEVKHVIVEGETEEHAASPEAIADASAVAVATAGAAAALAQETAAHAELQAAEEVAEVEGEVDEWKVATGTLISDLQANLATTSARLDEYATLNSANAESQQRLLERLLALEEAEAARLPPLTPPASEMTAPDITEQTEAAPIVGTEAEVTAGPVEASGGVSLAPTETNPPTNPTSARRAPRRWI